MIFDNFNPKKTTKLFGHKITFEFLKNLHNEKKIPQALLFSGEKGIGKSTLINHLIHYFFDKNNYDEKKYSINKKSTFYNQYIDNLHPNIIYLDGTYEKNIKIDDIRNLRQKLIQKPLNNNKRFIIFNDIEKFNVNSLNALLKIIEEPNNNNYFFLINNKSGKLLETINSRCLEIKIILTKEEKDDITMSLLEYFNQDIYLDKNSNLFTPGNFLKINYFFQEKKIDINDNFKDVLSKILNLFKKEKDIFYKDLIVFYTEYYLIKKKDTIHIPENNLLENRLFLLKKIDDFFQHNLNQNIFLNSLENRF